MKYLMILFLLPACGPRPVITKTVEVCSSDSPAFVLPDEVVCNNAPSESILVEGKTITYICTKIKGE